MKGLRRLFGRKPLDVTKVKDDAVSGSELTDGGFENSAQLFLRVALLGVRSPVLKLLGNCFFLPVFWVFRAVNGHFPETSTADLHQSFVHGNPHEPGVKARLSTKRGQAKEGFEECILDDFFVVLVIAGDVTAQAQNLAFSASDQLLDCGTTSLP